MSVREYRRVKRKKADNLEIEELLFSGVFAIANE